MRHEVDLVPMPVFRTFASMDCRPLYHYYVVHRTQRNIICEYRSFEGDLSEGDFYYEAGHIYPTGKAAA